ncbi:hypothetical protein ACTAZI_00505 [Legionella bozemanae]|uniref:hypothetical protein n=1 Tax=Legionella bozemanae TaxID=447 RepID=UPI003EEAEDF9
MRKKIVRPTANLVRTYATSSNSRIILNSALWHKKNQNIYIPISYDNGVKLTNSNTFSYLYNMGNSRYLVRSMNVKEFEYSPKMNIGGQEIPMGLSAKHQLIVYNSDGSINKEKTDKAFKAHHTLDTDEFSGSGLSFSDRYTIYSLFSFASGGDEVILFADPAGLPEGYIYIQGKEESKANIGDYGLADSSGEGHAHTAEYEATLLDLPNIYIPFALRRDGFRAQVNTNPFYINIEDPKQPEEVKKKAKEAGEAYLICCAAIRTGNPVPGYSDVTLEMAKDLQLQAIQMNLAATIEIVEMTPQEKDHTYALYKEISKKGAVASSHQFIEVEDLPKEVDNPEESNKKVKRTVETVEIERKETDNSNTFK